MSTRKRTAHRHEIRAKLAIALSNDTSATNRVNLAVSSSGIFRRFTSDGVGPLYVSRVLKNVASAIPAFRQTSATDVPSSTCFAGTKLEADVIVYAATMAR
ncbi:hypothetical protein So717_35280 [Roseobacter cerasinus]|uniref:Uncharacterized protein n=1 Tax=Roseobacter cerasinus TaxID=2602289 RepID=A0A640VXT8_9RHOB|nr:hypothetical protein So717_35280 [Roseobacter cerasinus]